MERIDAVGVAVNGKTIAARTVLWAAGVKASPAAKWLRARTDNAGRVKVAADLSVPNLKNVLRYRRHRREQRLGGSGRTRARFRRETGR